MIEKPTQHEMCAGMKQEITWNIDVARTIQAIGLLILLIYGMYNGYNKVDDFLDLRELEVGIAQMEVEVAAAQMPLLACEPCVCGS